MRATLARLVALLVLGRGAEGHGHHHDHRHLDGEAEGRHLGCGTPEPMVRSGPTLDQARRHVQAVFGGSHHRDRRHNRRLGISLDGDDGDGGRRFNRRMGIYEVSTHFEGLFDFSDSLEKVKIELSCLRFEGVPNQVIFVPVQC